MNGIVNNQKVVLGYLKEIIELFKNEQYLLAQREDMKKNPSYAFTEMRAFSEYIKAKELSVKYLQVEFNSSIFDDCLVNTVSNSRF